MSGLPLRSCVVTRTGWLRQPRPLRPPPEPCPQGPTWRAKRDWPGRDGAPRAWQVARRSSAGRRTTRNNGSLAGSPGGIVGMELVARSWSACPPSPVRTSSHFTLAFGSICASQPSEEVGYLVTKESLYSGAIRIPTASPALSIICLFAGQYCGRYCLQLPHAAGQLPPATVDTDCVSAAHQWGILRGFASIEDAAVDAVDTFPSFT
jgi:hypothetical protein